MEGSSALPSALPSVLFWPMSRGTGGVSGEGRTSIVRACIAERCDQTQEREMMKKNKFSRDHTARGWVWLHTSQPVAEGVSQALTA